MILYSIYIYHFSQAQPHFPSYMSLHSIHLTFLYSVMKLFFLSNNATLFQYTVFLLSSLLLTLIPQSLNKQSRPTAAWLSAFPFLPSFWCLRNMGDCKQPIQFVEYRSVLGCENCEYSNNPFLFEHSWELAYSLTLNKLPLVLNRYHYWSPRVSSV